MSSRKARLCRRSRAVKAGQAISQGSGVELYRIPAPHTFEYAGAYASEGPEALAYSAARECWRVPASQSANKSATRTCSYIDGPGGAAVA
jgi:hypothetical protein